MPAEFILPPYKVSTLLSRLCLPWTSQQGRRPHVPKQLLLLPRALPPPLPCFQSTPPPSTCLLGQKLRTQPCPALPPGRQAHLSSVSFQVQPPLLTFFHLHQHPWARLPPSALASSPSWSSLCRMVRVVLSKHISHHIALLLTTLLWSPLTLVGSVLQAGWPGSWTVLHTLCAPTCSLAVPQTPRAHCPQGSGRHWLLSWSLLPPAPTGVTPHLLQGSPTGHLAQRPTLTSLSKMGFPIILLFFLFILKKYFFIWLRCVLVAAQVIFDLRCCVQDL